MPAFQVQNPSRQDQQAVIQFLGAEDCQTAEINGSMLDPPGSSYCLEEKVSQIAQEGWWFA
jgi:hypothetical protein